MDITKSILNNPFRTLDADASDPKRRLIELADEAALLGADHADEALTALTNSNSRLEAETDWFPGASAAVIRSLTAYDAASCAAFPETRALTPLAQVNACRILLEAWPADTADDAVAICRSMALAFDAVRAQGVMDDINADRAKAGFQLLTDVAGVADRLAALRKDVTERLYERISSVKGMNVRAVMNLVVDAYKGARSPLLEELVDFYALRTHDDAQKLQEAVLAGVKALEAGGMAASLIKTASDLQAKLGAWGEMTEPLRRLKAVKGHSDEESLKVYALTRSASIDLHNKHHLTDSSYQMMMMLKHVFGDFAPAKPYLTKDIAALEQMRAQMQFRR